MNVQVKHPAGDVIELVIRADTVAEQGLLGRFQRQVQGAEELRHRFYLEFDGTELEGPRVLKLFTTDHVEPKK